MDVRFDALEHRADGGFSPVALRFAGDPATGWQLERNGRPHLALGPGYDLLEARACGVCATDLARRFLPFPLPQVIGHEVLAHDAAGGRRVVEINASCTARGRPPCATCAAGRPNHCPERRVLGIHDLPGGFGRFVLAPVHAALAVPAGLPDETAALVEPFAAALHAVRTVAPRAGDRVLVLGPRRLGMLVVAALAAERRRTGVGFEVVAGVRRRALGELARELGADAFEAVGPDGPAAGSADVVVDTTGAPEGLEHGLRAARRELHVKSTHGRPAGGLAQGTALVVDELRIAPLEDAPPEAPAAWLASGAPPAGAGWQVPDEGGGAPGAVALAAGGARFATVAVDDAATADAAIRPDPAREDSLLEPGGALVVPRRARPAGGPLLEAVAARGLVVSTSRCGDFRDALDLLAVDPALAGLGPRLVTHRFGPDALAEAFGAAASPDARKVLVVHPRA